MKKNEILLNKKKNISKEEITLAFDNKIKSQDIEILKKEIEDLKKEKDDIKKNSDETISKYANEISQIKGQFANDSFNKDNEIIKYKGLAKKYRDLLIEKGIIKQKK